MLSSGLTLIFSMMGVLNFAHTSLPAGAYFRVHDLGWWASGPPGAGAPGRFALGAAFERYCLRRVHKFGHVPELLITFGLSYLILEVVQLVWGRSTVPYGLPEQLQGPLFTLYGTQFPKSRSFVMLVALLMLVSVWLLLTRTRIGLVIQAALKYPRMAEALGHNVPRVFMLVFGGGAALAGLAGVSAAIPCDRARMARRRLLIFVVVVVGAWARWRGPFWHRCSSGWCSLCRGVDYSLILCSRLWVSRTDQTFGYPLLKLTISQWHPSCRTCSSC